MGVPDWVTGIEGDFPIHIAVQDSLPKETKIISAESWGLSAWNSSGKLTAVLADGTQTRYFLKHSHAISAEPSLWGQYESVMVMNKAVPGCVPEAVAKGDYFDDQGNHVYFFLQKYHDMDMQSPPDPQELAVLLADLHSHKSPSGRFGFDVPVAGGILILENKWEDTWAAQFTNVLKATIDLDNAANPPWPEYDIVCKQVIDYVIPRLLGALQSDGRSIDPVLVHMDLWEGNVARDLETGKLILYDPCCVYAHNEVEFGTWRCSWATHFNSPIYQMFYQRLIEPSEPVEEFDDRNRLYAARASLCDSGGHAGSRSRQIAYNDMLLLCEKYAPFEHPDRYDPMVDISVTGISQPYDVMQGINA